MPRWVGPAFLTFSIGMVPWIVYLGNTLPQRTTAGHYRGAWVGFDVMLMAALFATGWLAARGRRRVAMPAVITATLLVVDAWFDVMTTVGREERLVSVLMALLVELPLAAMCLWIAGHVQRVVAGHLLLLGEPTEEQPDPPDPPTVRQSAPPRLR
ncbi:MAG: hypothetical protein ACYCXA_00485 [Actinomycetes bacterium]